MEAKALIQQPRTLESRSSTLATATQYEVPEAAVVTLPAFLDRYLVIRRQDNARAQYWFDATRASHHYSGNRYCIIRGTISISFSSRSRLSKRH